MKRCCYCGRGNEEEASHCSGCGTTEFEEPSLIKNSDTAAGTPSVTCRRCGATTDVPETFVNGQQSLGSSCEAFCPSCWQKHKASTYKPLLLGNFALGLFGLVFLALMRDHEFAFFLLNLFLFQVSLILIIPIHELAHAWVGHMLNYRVFLIHIGFGKTILKRKLLGFDTEVRSLPVCGAVAAAPRTTRHFRLGQFAFVAAGLSSNVILLIGAFGVMRASSESFGGWTSRLAFVQMFLFANLAVLLENLWPRNIATPVGQIPSDGLLLIRALSTDPKKAAASHASWFLLEGALCHKKHEDEEGRSWFERGLQLYPDNLQLLTAHAGSLLLLKQFKEARECFVALLPRLQGERLLRAVVLNDIAYADAVLGDSELLDEAERYSQQAMATLNWHPSIRGTRGTVLLVMGKPEESIQLLRGAMQNHEDPRNKAENACWLAMALEKTGDLKASSTFWAEARKLDPNCFLLERQPTQAN